MPLNGGLLSSEEVHVRQSPGPLLGRSSQRRHRRATFTLSLALFDVMKQRKADMAYRSRAHRHPAPPPHTRRPRARPTPAGRKGSDRLGRKVEYLALHVRERREK